MSSAHFLLLLSNYFAGLWVINITFNNISVIPCMLWYSVLLLEWFSLSIFYLLKCAKRIRHKLNKLMKSSHIYTIRVTTLFDRACMLINISYINMCKFNKNREQRKEWKRERIWWWWCVWLFIWWTLKQETFQTPLYIQGVCGCSFGEHLNKKPFRPLYIFKHVLKNNFVLFIWKNRITIG